MGKRMSERYQSLTGHLEKKLKEPKKLLRKTKHLFSEKVIQRKMKLMKKIMFQIRNETTTT